MKHVVDRLRDTVEETAEAYRSVDPARAATRPVPGKWSAAEILGHLIDSAANNHRRFVMASSKDDLVFDGYAQDEWVEVQAYRETPWTDLVDLWRAYNLHLARVMDAVPAAVRDREHTRHNLHQIAFRAMPPGEPATLRYLMEDYVTHLEHHLGQIHALLEQSAIHVMEGEEQP